MKTLFYIITLLGAILGGFQLFSTLAFAESAPQEASGAAIALAFAAIPYIFARSVEKLGQVSFADALKQQWEREQAARQAAAQQRQQPPPHNPITFAGPTQNPPTRPA